MLVLLATRRSARGRCLPRAEAVACHFKRTFSTDDTKSHPRTNARSAKQRIKYYHVSGIGGSAELGPSGTLRIARAMDTLRSVLGHTDVFFVSPLMPTLTSDRTGSHSQAEGHEIFTDVTRAQGGKDSAPQPVNLLLGALIGCETATAVSCQTPQRRAVPMNTDRADHLRSQPQTPSPSP